MVRQKFFPLLILRIWLFCQSEISKVMETMDVISIVVSGQDGKHASVAINIASGFM